MRRRKRKSRQMKLIVIGSICILSVMTVGYAAFGTSLDISAKGKIVKNETTSETIKNKYCNASSGDGLYKDALEEGRCIYRGSNPNNYITFNGEEAGWRIVSIENDGTMKIMKMDSLGNMRFDKAETRYQGSTGYCNVIDISLHQYGCNVWGSASTMLDASGNNVTSMPRKINGTEYPLPTEEAQMTKYLNNDYYGTLTDEAKGQIDNHLWNVGPLEETNQTLETDVSQEKAYKWRGKVGLINPSDYVKASTYSSCTNIYNDVQSSHPCKNNNYMYQSSYRWLTISPSFEDASHTVWVVNVDGELSHSYIGANVRPVIYLTSNISLDGSGTINDPYKIKM